MVRYAIFELIYVVLHPNCGVWCASQALRLNRCPIRPHHWLPRNSHNDLANMFICAGIQVKVIQIVSEAVVACSLAPKVVKREPYGMLMGQHSENKSSG
jgi:hypothetical protein